jgi:LysM repeat protein
MTSLFLLPTHAAADAPPVETPRAFAKPMVQRHVRHTLVIAIALVFAGCSSNPPQSKMPKPANKKSHSAATAHAMPQGNIDFESADSLEELLQATDMEAVEGDRLAVLRYGNLWNRIRAGYKMNIAVENSRINAQRNWFVSRQPYIDRLSARASRYLYYTVTEAERRGIPTELALLPVIESSYDPFATSNAAAAGMWQFIPSTGRIYGLRQDQYYDGRRDVVESTRAAYDFLTSLYQQFGSWELALASYNAGGGRIQQAINRNVAAGLPTDYWSLRLPEETMNYVPRFMAVAQIMKNPENYGIQLPSIANRPHFRSVQLPGPVDLAQVVSTTGLSSKEVFELNPAFLQGVTSPTGPFRVLIPTSLSPVVDTRLKALQVVDPTRFGFSSDSSYLAMNTPAITQSITRSDARSVNTSQAAAIMSSGTSSSSLGNLGTSLSSASSVTSTSTATGGNLGNVAPSTTITRNTQRIPSGADALAAMANQAKVPSQATIQSAVANVGSGSAAVSRPVASVAAAVVKPTDVAPLSVTTITPSTSMTITRTPAVNSNPNISVSNTVPASTVTAPQPVTQSPIIVAPATAPNVTPILAMTIDNKDTDQKTTTVPMLSSDDKTKVVDEIKSIAPANTAVVDPLDGKIPLTSIQTQQSVLDKQGETKSLSYEQPYLKTPTASDIKTRKLIPAETKVVADVKPVEKPKGTRTIYIVKAGDTLSNVATKTGLAWREIAKWNQMDTNANLITGTPLYLYGAKKAVEAPTSYVVQSGDTLTDVAAQFNMSPRQLADLNRMKPTSNLITGTRLTLVEDDSLPAKNSAAKDSKDSGAKTAAKAVDNSKDAQSDTDDYAIKRGDTLAKVAARYHVTTASLAKLNGIPMTASLQKGDTLSVPAADQPTQKAKATDKADRNDKADKSSSKKDSAQISTKDYTVHAGETLARIAAKNGLSVAALADLNNIPAETRIQTGDTLSIPDSGKASKRKGSRD